MKNALLTLSTLALGATLPLGAQSILYLENFNTTEGFQRPSQNTGWQASRGGGLDNSGGPNALGEVGGADDPIPYNNQSVLGNPAGVNNNPIPGATYGHGFWSPTAIFNVAFATQEFGGFNSSEIQSISWDMLINGTSGTQIMRAMIQVGGSASDTDNWYVSNPVLSINVAARNQEWHRDVIQASGDWIRMPSYNFATGAFQWPSSSSDKTEADFAAYADYTFFLGALPEGTVHGFGLFVDNRAGGNMRIDNYTITAIPEPTTYAAIFGLFALGFIAWRRRR
ncbi:MAG: PEP-CTERM sorting domain-containing protein [Opitutales bacterium]|nr:PEP-CTERM sorting domain-containing protein [Opitutales bacterium]